MNTQDFKPFIKSWEEIYALQGELQLMYRPYFKERIANFDINTLEDQELFKKLCWQIVEELTEAMEAAEKPDDEHLAEELIDAFNFMLELYQLYGMTPTFVWTLPKWAQVLEDEVSPYPLEPALENYQVNHVLRLSPLSVLETVCRHADVSD